MALRISSPGATQAASRDNAVAGFRNVGYWQADLQGLEHLTRADHDSGRIEEQTPQINGDR